MTNYPNITINLYDPYPIRVLNIKQYDTGRGAMVTLTGLGGEVITPTGNGLYVLAKKRDGNIVYNTVTLVGNQIKIDFDEQMTVLSGLLQVEIQMIDAQGKTISTPIFAVNVMPSNINPLQIESTSEFGALTDALADVENLKQNGLKGDPGDAATIQVGTVTATDPGGNPAVTNSGTEQDAVLDFTLPRGEPGSIWYQGSAITGANTSGTVFTGSGIANAELNDMYLNTGSGTDKGNVYVCVLAGDANTAKWAYKQNIMGPTGPAGTANASSVAYNNESSGLTAGNVQGALDELTNNMTKTTAIITVPNGVSLNQNKSVICNGILYCRIQLQLTSEIGKNEKIFTVADNLQGFTQATIIDSNLNTMYPIFGMDKEFYNKHSSALSIGFYAVCFTAPL